MLYTHMATVGVKGLRKSKYFEHMLFVTFQFTSDKVTFFLVEVCKIADLQSLNTGAK